MSGELLWITVKLLNSVTKIKTKSYLQSLLCSGPKSCTLIQVITTHYELFLEIKRKTKSQSIYHLLYTKKFLSTRKICIQP